MRDMAVVGVEEELVVEEVATGMRVGMLDLL